MAVTFMFAPISNEANAVKLFATAAIAVRRIAATASLVCRLRYG